MSDKYTPNFEVKDITAEDGTNQVQYIFSVPEESSAKDIEIDISSA